jgi:hypothetical protein
MLGLEAGATMGHDQSDTVQRGYWLLTVHQRAHYESSGNLRPEFLLSFRFSFIRFILGRIEDLLNVRSGRIGTEDVGMSIILCTSGAQRLT